MWLRTSVFLIIIFWVKIHVRTVHFSQNAYFFSPTWIFANFECARWTRSSSLHIILWILLLALIGTGHWTENNVIWRTKNNIKCGHERAFRRFCAQMCASVCVFLAITYNSYMRANFATGRFCSQKKQKKKKRKRDQSVKRPVRFGSVVCRAAGKLCETYVS